MVWYIFIEIKQSIDNVFLDNNNKLNLIVIFTIIYILMSNNYIIYYVLPVQNKIK